MNVQEFVKFAKVYAVNSSVWLVEEEMGLATHCSDITYNLKDWEAVYPPTFENFLAFLNDPNWIEESFKILKNSSIRETVYILSSPKNKERLDQALESVKQGNLKPQTVEELFNEINL